MDPQLLLERLREGISIDELMAESARAEPSADLEMLWRRCALVRVFDRDLYDQVLARGLDVPGFEELIANPDVEVFPTAPPSFYVRDEVRRRCFAAWKRDQSELRRVSSTLVEYYQMRSAPIDVFVHRIFAAPEEALADFEKLYLEADDKFDLAGCDTLLLLIRNRLDLIDEGSPLRDALNRREQYLHSRTLFTDDYYRTVSYLQRDSLTESCERFLTEPRSWILHVYGKGGSGKTMFVRWLVARRCVKEHDNRRIPVARLDFDGLDLASFSRWPWLILPAIGEQLQQQLESSAFVSFLLETGEFAPLLRRTSFESPTASLRKKLNTVGKALGGSAEAWFASALADMPVVVVLDTIEEPLLHYKAALRSILELFVRIRRSCPGFRVVLSGRYNIADPTRLPATTAALAGEGSVECCHVAEFTRDESLRFLHEFRRVSRAEAVLAAVHEHTRGNPLELSLFAELLHSDPSISTPGQVREVYPITRFAYLLDRIIKRIPDSQEAMRWLLRYAVVPRSLTRQLFVEVLAKHMPEAARRDAPNEFKDALAPRYGGQEVWKRIDQQLKVDRVWKALESYAGASSWVVAEEGELRLQPEVVNPMRDLLQAQSDETFRFLHGQAAAYFERRARREKSRWAEHITEAIYHRFQLDGRKAVPFWRAQLADPRAKDPAVRERLAAVVLGSEFLDDETLEPRPHPRTKTVVDRETCARAAFEVCLAALTQRLRMTRQDPEARKLQEQIVEYAEKLERLHRGLKAAVVPAHRRTFLKGVVAIYRDRPNEGERLVRAALARETRRDVRLLMELCLALTQRFTRPRDVDRHFEAARQLAAQTGSRSLPPPWIDYRCGWFHLASLDFTTAGERFGRAYRKMVQERPRPPEIVDCLRRAVQAALETGQLTEARRLLDLARNGSGRRTYLHTQRLISRAQVALQELDPLRAQRHVDAVREMAEEWEEHGVLAELDGDVAAALLQTHDMERHYAAAGEAYARAGSFRGQINCHLKRVRYYLVELGQGAQARSLLSQTRRQSLDPQDATERHLLSARLAALSKTPLVFGPRGGLPPAQRARALAAVLATGRPSPVQVQRFLKALAMIRLPTMRGEALREFAATDPEIVPQPSTVTRLMRLASPAAQRDEQPVHAYHLAAALRRFGGGRRALKLLEQALEQRKLNPYLAGKIRLAMAALDPRRADDFAAALRASSDLPGLRATLLLQEAERFLTLGEPEAAAQRLAEARETLETLGDDTIWHVRAEELSGRLAELAGAPEKALAGYRTALECARRSENLAAQMRLELRIGELRGHGRAKARPLEVRSPAMFLEVAAFPRALRVAIRSPEGERSTRKIPVDGEPNLVAAALLQSPGSASPPEMLNLLRRPDPRVEAAASEIIGTAARRRSLDLALKAADRSAAAFPWEMALDPKARRFVYRAPAEEVGPRETVRWIQTVLSALGHPVKFDGALGPQTQAALRTVVPAAATASPRSWKKRLRSELRRSRPEAARVLLLRAGLEQERMQKRGHGAIGLDVARCYRQWAGEPDVEETRQRDPEELARLIREFRPALVHLVTGFLESSSTGEIHLDFVQSLGPETKTAQSVRFTAGLFKFLGRLAGEESPPFVVVEAILPDDDYARARQVLLRNAFCAELLLHARTRGVLATGLFPARTLLGPYKSFFELLAKNPSAGELHRHAWTHLPAAFPPALFTVDPDLPALR